MPTVRDLARLATLRPTPRRLLAVFAHPDDEAYGCAGALFRHGRRADGATALLCLTRGEAAAVGAQRGLTPAALGALREERLERVAGILGLDALLVPGLPDGRLARLDLDVVDAPVRAALDALQPQVVVTHDPRGVNGHADHVAVHWAVRRALVGRPATRLAMVAYPPAVCESARPRLLFATPPEEIDVTLVLGEEEIRAKEACLRVHEAIVTLVPSEPDGRALRPPVEHYDLLGEPHSPPLADLFG